MVVVASNGGDDRQPKWLLNLRDDPKVEVTMDGRTTTHAARGSRRQTRRRSSGRAS